MSVQNFQKRIGLHKNCNVCLIDEIKDEKENKIKSNIKYLEEISNSLNDSINKLKIILKKLSKIKKN